MLFSLEIYRISSHNICFLYLFPYLFDKLTKRMSYFLILFELLMCKKCHRYHLLNTVLFLAANIFFIRNMALNHGHLPYNWLDNCFLWKNWCFIQWNLLIFKVICLSYIRMIFYRSIFLQDIGYEFYKNSVFWR